MPRSGYRLPDGKYTTSATKMAKAWHALADPICEATGAEVVGFDPLIHFSYTDDSMSSWNTFQLPPSFCAKLCAILKEKK